MVVATEMVMVGAGMVVRWTCGAMAGSFHMQKTDGDMVRGGNPGLLNRVGDGKDSIDGKRGHHSYQCQCNYFSEIPVQSCS